jgi:hypothetical protein
MLLGLGAGAIVVAALLWELSLPRLRGSLPALRGAISRAIAARGVHGGSPQFSYDPGRELRAEQRARALLRSCVNEEEWAMYRDLGYLRVWGGEGSRDGGGVSGGGVSGGVWGDGSEGSGRARAGRYAYLIYPHRPIVAYLPRTGALLNEYCVAFPDDTRPFGSARLPDADDVLAKWMALTADERRLIADANMHLPGRQVDPEQVREDLARLARWEHERERLQRRGRGPGSVPTRCPTSTPSM